MHTINNIQNKISLNIYNLRFKIDQNTETYDIKYSSN